MIIPETGQILISGGDARPEGNYNGGVQDVNLFDHTTETAHSVFDRGDAVRPLVR